MNLAYGLVLTCVCLYRSALTFEVPCGFITTAEAISVFLFFLSFFFFIQFPQMDSTMSSKEDDDLNIYKSNQLVFLIKVF